MKKCPFCREEIQDDAIKCKHCGTMLNQAQDVSAPEKDTAFYDAPKKIPTKALLAGEKIFLEVKPDVSGIVIFQVILLLIFTPLWAIAPVVPILLACLIIGTLLGWNNTIYALTNKRVLSFSGVLSRGCRQCPLEKIQNFEYKKSAVSSMGYITFDTAGTGFKEIIWKNIAHAEDIYHKISAVIHK